MRIRFKTERQCNLEMAYGSGVYLMAWCLFHKMQFTALRLQRLTL